MAKRVIDDSTLTAIADRMRNLLQSNLAITPLEMPGKCEDAFNKAWGYGKTEGESAINMFVVNPARDKISKRIADTTGVGTLDEWVDKAIEDFDSIKTALDAQGASVPANNTSLMGVLVNGACETKKVEGIEQGKQAQYNEFWKNYMGNLNKAWAQKSAFAGIGWNDITFNPPLSFNPYNQKICETFFKDSAISDLAGILKRNDVTFNFSGCTYFDDFATASSIKYFPVLDMSSAARFSNTFSNCTKMVSIEKWIISSEGNQVFSTPFYNCPLLKDIVVEGAIGNSISFSVSPLSEESIMGKVISAEEYEVLSDTVKTNNVYICDDVYYYGGIITALSSTTTGKTLTLKKSAVDTAFETVEGLADGSNSEEWIALIATKPNWTISLV